MSRVRVKRVRVWVRVRVKGKATLSHFPCPKLSQDHLNKVRINPSNERVSGGTATNEKMWGAEEKAWGAQPVDASQRPPFFACPTFYPLYCFYFFSP